MRIDKDRNERLDGRPDGIEHFGVEKLLEDALIKLSSVATDLLGVSARAMIEALIAGERDPKALADLARGKLNAKRAALLEALNGRFDDHPWRPGPTLVGPD